MKENILILTKPRSYYLFSKNVTAYRSYYRALCRKKKCQLYVTESNDLIIPFLYLAQILFDSVERKIVTTTE